MKNKMTFGVMKNIVCCMVVLLPLQLGSIAVSQTNSELSTDTLYSESADEEPVPTRVVLMDLKEEYCSVRCYLAQNQKTVKFMTETFGVNMEDVIEDIVKRNDGIRFKKNNIGALVDSLGDSKEYGSFEEGLIEYLFIYCQENPNKVDNTRVPYTSGAKYVENLIKYFTSIYDNVDYLTAVSIGAAESGYYKVTYMLKANNIFGGMSSNGLIKYKNIEYGVLSYVRLLSKNYYGKGLNTLESIGRVYCPAYDENGQKVASSHWINLVSKAKEYYSGDDSDISIAMLVND